VNKAERSLSIIDNGGDRSGKDRRQIAGIFLGNDKRSGHDRRQGKDRRSGQNRRRSPANRRTKFYWDGSRIERRDAFRKNSEFFSVP